MRSNSRWLLLAVAILALAGAAIVGSAGAASAQSADCDVVVQNGESIQDAINGSATDATICVEDGTYETELTIDVEGLTLTAADGATPVLDGNETLNTAIDASVSDVVVDGFEIRAYEDSSVVLDGASNATIRNLNVTYGEYSSDGHGIHVLNSPDVSVDDSVVVDHEHGIYVDGSDGLSVENVTATGNSGETTSAGIYVEGSLGVAVRNSTLEANSDGIRMSSGGDQLLLANSTVLDNGIGVNVYDSDEVEIHNNTIHESNGQGVAVSESTGVVVAGNDLEEASREPGILIDRSSHRAEVVNNVIVGAGDEGIRVEDSNDLTIAGNLLKDNSQYVGDDSGIHLRNSIGSAVAENVVRNSGIRGIYLNGQTDYTGSFGPVEDTIVENNTVTGHAVGLDLVDSVNASVVGNDLEAGLTLGGSSLEHFDHTASNNTVGGDPIFFANGEDAPTIPADAAQVIVVDSTNVDVSGHSFSDVAAGVQIAYSDAAVVDDNTLAGMAGDGDLFPYRGSVTVWGSSTVTLSENVVDGSDGHGIVLYDSTTPAIQTNTVNATVREGILLDGTTGATLSENDVSNSDEMVGIHLQEASHDATIVVNDVTNNELAGIMLEESDGATVSNNTVTGNDRGIALYVAADVLVTGNEVADNDHLGIGPRHGSDDNENVTIRANVVTGNGDGIGSGNDVPEVTIADNVITDTDGVGVSAHSGVATNNAVTGSAEYGIVADAAAIVSDNHVSDSLEHGIVAYGGEIRNNTIADNGMDGIHLDGFEDDRIANNTVSGHTVDLRTVESTNATIVDNAFESGIFVDGTRYGNYQGNLEYLQHEIANNTVRGDPLFYAASVDDPAVPADAGQVVLFNVTNTTVADQSFEGVASPVQVTYSDAVQVTNVSVIDSPIDGATIGVSENVTIAESTISGSDGHGVIAMEVGAFVVSESVVTASSGNGLTIELLDPANDSALTDNTVTDNAVGIDLESDPDFDGLTVRGNVVHDNDEGLVLDGDAVDLVVSENSFDGNGIGLFYDAPYSPPDLNATDNWWGNASGPSGGVTDACTSTVADGDGDSIEEAEDGVVCFEPWLTEAPIDGPAATFTVSPGAPYEGDEVTFDASGSSAPDGIAEYRWDFTGDGSVDATTADPTVTHTYATDGSYDVELTVEDANGVTDTVNETVQIEELDPLAAAFEWEPLTPEPGESVTFDAGNSTSPSGAIVDYRWDLTGDGSVDQTTTGPTVTHTYADAGSYPVELEVEDGSGQTNATTQSIHVAEEGEAIWDVTTDELIDGSSPTIVDGTAYIGDENGTVYAIDVDTGTVEWRFHHDPYPDADSPTVVDGVVYVASQEIGTIDTDEHRLHAIDADTGEELWDATLERPPRGSTVYGDTVYVTTGGDWDVYNGYVLAFDADDGTQQWSYETTTPTTSAPTVTDGTVYAGDDVGNLYALDADTGDEAWTWEGEDEIPHAPTVADGTVYVPVNDLIPNFEVDVNQYRGYVYALDAEDGSEVWDEPFADAEVDRGITAAPTVHNGTLYVAGGGDTLYAVDTADGDELWTFGSTARIRGSPTVVEAPGELHRTIADELVVVGNDDGSLYGVGTAHGVAHWIFDANGSIRSSPTIADGVVYVGADHFEPGDPNVVGDDGVRHGHLYAVGTNVTRSSADSRIVLGTLGHNERLQPYFDVEITSTNAPVLEGETLEINATVRNLGGEGTQTVEIEDFAGNVVESRTMTLAYGEERSINATVQTQEGDATIEDVVARSEGDSHAASVGIQQETEIAGCAVLDTPGVYTLTGGQSSDSTCIVITSSYVEVHGQGHVLIGGGPSQGSMDPGAHGIHVDGSDGQLRGVVIDDVRLDDWASFQVDNAAIRVENATDSAFTNVTVGDSYYGIWADDLSNSLIADADLTGATWHGAQLGSSPNNTITDTEIAGSYYGLVLNDGSNDTVVTDSDLLANHYGFSVAESSGVELSNVDARYNHGDAAAPEDLGAFFATENDPVSVENYTLSAPSNVTIEGVVGDSADADTVYTSDTVDVNVSTDPAPEFTVAFEASNVDLEAVHAPADNPHAHALGQYLAVSDEPGTPSYLDLEIHYEESHLDGASESALSLWRYDTGEDAWTELADQSVDTDRNVIATNVTTVGTLGVFVDDPGEADSTSPATDEVADVTVVAAGDNSWQNLEESATQADGTTWNATIDVSDLPTSVNDTYDLWVTAEDDFGGTRSFDIAEDLEVVEEPTAELFVSPIGPSLPDTGDADFGTVDVTVEETADVETENLAVTLRIANASAIEGESISEFAYEETISDRELRDESDVFSFDVGSIDVESGYVAIATANAENADDSTANHEVPTPFEGAVEIAGPIDAAQDEIEVSYSVDEGDPEQLLLVVRNNETGGTVTEPPTSGGSITVNVTDLGGIDEGDSIWAALGGEGAGVVAEDSTTVAEPDDGGSSPSPSPPSSPSPPLSPAPEPETVVSMDDTDDGAAIEVTDATANDPVTIPLAGTVSPNGTNLTALEVTTSEDADFEASVAAHEEPPADASDLPESAGAMLYLDVEHDLEDDQIEGAAFEFTVSTEALDDRGVAAEDVVLYHLVDGQWTERETTVLEERTTEVDLRAEIPHFSWFAIASTAPSFELGDSSLSTTELTVGDELTVESVVENVGTADGETDVSLEIGGEPVDSTAVTVDAGGQSSTTFEVTFEEAGTYDVAVDGQVIGSVTVSEATAADETNDDDADATGDEDDEDDSSDDGSPGFGVAATLVALLTIALLARRRA